MIIRYRGLRSVLVIDIKVKSALIEGCRHNIQTLTVCDHHFRIIQRYSQSLQDLGIGFHLKFIGNTKLLIRRNRNIGKIHFFDKLISGGA